MATRKKRKNTKSAPQSIRALIRKAREAGHDTLGIMNDPEALGALEFMALTQNLTERLAATFPQLVAPDATGAGAVATASIARAVDFFMWEPVATCVVRAMIRELCAGMCATTDDGSVSYDGLGVQAIARDALDSARSRLGDNWVPVVNGQFNRVAGLIADVFMDTERFSQPAQLKCREVAHIFHRDGDTLVVKKGGA